MNHTDTNDHKRSRKQTFSFHHIFIIHYAERADAADSVIFSCCLSVFLSQGQSHSSKELVHRHMDLRGEGLWERDGHDHKDVVGEDLWK